MILGGVEFIPSKYMSKKGLYPTLLISSGI